MSASCSNLLASPYLQGLTERLGEPDGATAEAAVGAIGVDADLPALKDRFNLGWAYLALCTETPYSALGQLQSAFADAAIEAALSRAWARRKLPGEPRGLFILGLGKLGGHDLNVSSDIDLIAYFDPDSFPVPQARGQAYVANQLMRDVTQALQPRAGPFAFRVDWRLRPEASVSGLAMSTSRARDFYFSRALPWHRLALLKARVVAGDRAAGEAFLAELSPFIWRQNLDFRAIDQLAELKRRINLEHPRLRLERERRDPIGDTPLGFNVKLGTGGIREIEFIANAQQMVWGGKRYALRTTNTLAALAALGADGLVEGTDSLATAYRDHRRLENALQLMRNGQEHVLPSAREDWQPIADLMGDTVDALFARTTAHRRTVHARFEAMFASDTPAAISAPALPALDKPAQAIADDWARGFRRYGVSESGRARLVPLGAALTERLADAGDPDDAILRVDRYLGSLSRSGQYLALLAANPGLLDALIGPLLHSPHMGVLLEQSPHIIDTFLAPGAGDAAFVLAETDYETRLERLRRFVNEGLFQSYHAFLGTGDAPALSNALTGLAETAIATALTIVRDDLGAPELAISVLGLGKLGERRMAPQSDLDLVFLFEDSVDRDLAARAVRRLRTTLTTPLREGIAYELDMRLRPSGRSGPPAVTLPAFLRHHDGNARTWEHIALVPARVVAGDAALGAKVTRAVADILSRPRDADQLHADAHYMWGKLEAERIRDVPPDRWGTKLRRGGLMQADFWGAVDVLRGGSGAAELQVAWTALLYWERLLGLTGRTVAEVPERYADVMPNGIAERQAALEAEVATLTARAPEGDAETMRPVAWG